MAALLDDWVKFEALVQIFVGSMMWPRSPRNFMMLSSSTSSPLAWKSSIQVPTAIHVLTNHIYKRLSNNLDYSKFRQVSRRLNMDNQYLWISLNNFLTRQRRKYKTFVIFRQKRIDHKCKRENQMCLTMCTLTSKHTIGKHRRGGGSRARWMHIFRTFLQPSLVKRLPTILDYSKLVEYGSSIVGADVT